MRLAAWTFTIYCALRGFGMFMQPERIYTMMPHIDIAGNTETNQVRDSFPCCSCYWTRFWRCFVGPALVGLAVAPGAPHEEAGGGRG